MKQSNILKPTVKFSHKTSVSNVNLLNDADPHFFMQAVIKPFNVHTDLLCRIGRLVSNELNGIVGSSINQYLIINLFL